ncbi:hypothetical protein [Pseudomonas synxantha]|uniref:Uncharacterized protein n=1 Tax=Pseudomonas synxantha TaxID=47883 RepID=A0AAX3IA70_9PSED|nr:hypothetical protein [Pseudomonas synxantha]AZE66565.1 hypothetical protein C4K01_2370 [Pseudomonas synxantha]MBI6566325.1 hypothetical protein [Pseudomonas synxantha]MBI6578893.1 hypothetical protein [Pseudomonas synxantha]MBI6645270.1 hypothetical protein [Pseudomonas synxantha]SDU38441.1 hypothetical protein SAMN05216475_2827 [Pseudomonas synxantha]
MQYNDTYTQMMACRQLAMEQNQKLFNQANALSRSAYQLLERPDLDSELFDQYLHLRGKAEALFREAIDHLGVLNEHFPAPSSLLENERSRNAQITKEVA